MMQFATAEGAQGICPEGWHLPSDAEICTLELELDPSIICNSNSWRGTDGGTQLKQGGSSGFDTQMGGYRDTNTQFYFADSYASLWSSTENGRNGWYRYLSIPNSTVFRGNWNKSIAYSVRCVKDSN